MNPDLVLFYPEGHAAHAAAGHPERPERVETIRSGLQQAGWWEPFPQLRPLPIPEDVLYTVHDPSYLSRLELACRQSEYLDLTTYTTPASWQLALNAAGGALAVAKAVWRGEARRGLALTRPPGHHASHQRGMGFCLLNHIALAAEALIRHEGAQRLAIVDIDLHHGNGTQDIFWRRGDVLYLSTHQSPLYPGTGWLDERGEGPGEGKTANFPLPSGSGDQAFRTVVETLILPLLDRFSPQMILVSYGFDAHWQDVFGNLLFTAEGYGEGVRQLTRWVDEHCQGRIALFLEGGYNLEAGVACTDAVVAAMLGHSWQDPIGPSPYTASTAWQAIVQQAYHLWGL
jgi:acetoin utilization deacetylase AcuC-like enzyme